MNPWTPVFIIVGFVAVAAIASIWRERRAEHRDLMNRRIRHYQGRL